MAASSKLKKKVNQYCISERKKRKQLTNNYGSVCVGVEYAHMHAGSHSFGNDSNYTYEEDLKTKLSAIGTIGEDNIGNCYLGYCAEPHAANLLLKKLNGGHHIYRDTSKFTFSIALRIRTHQEVDYCKFCRKTFPQL